MTLKEAISARHSVRKYSDKPLSEETKNDLIDYISQVNAQSGLHIQLVCDEPKAFDGFLAHYGKFSGVKNYIAVIGKKSDDLQEKCGYYGQKIVLYAQTLELNTCWVAMTYKKIKTAFVVEKDEKLVVVIALGYGEAQGVPHHGKAAEELFDGNYETAPDWFKAGMEAAMLAPTAVNQQKFKFSLDGNKVSARALSGLYSEIDLGIVKCNFEIGAGRENFVWA